MSVERIATGSFDARVVRETMYGTTDAYGVVHSTVTLYRCTPNLYCVEWCAGDLDPIYIGIWTQASSKRIANYDGVFSLPKEIVAFLRGQGFETPEGA